jgi:beta-phosphoglucomutase-like phosphatase (HAD superfamily)
VIRGVLFDLDGTLADTEPLQWQAYRQVLEPFGVDVGMEEYRVHWIATDGGAEYACETYRLPIDAAELRRRKTPRIATLIAEGVAPCPGRAKRSSASRRTIASRSRRTACGSSETWCSVTCGIAPRLEASSRARTTSRRSRTRRVPRGGRARSVCRPPSAW